MKIGFEEHGKGEPLVLLHAFPLSRKMWRPQVKAISTEKVRLIIPDLRGFGGTAVSSDVNAMDEMARDIGELLDDLQIEKAIIGGLSMGGYVTFSLFRIRPQLLKGLVFCDTNCAADTDEKRENRSSLIEKIEEAGMQALIDNMLPSLIGEFTKENNIDLVSELKQRFAETDPQAAIAALRGMAQRKDHTYLLSEIDVPTLFIVGDQDELTGPDIAEKMHGKVRGSALAVINVAGHYSNLEQPEQFNRALVSFCNSVFDRH